MKIKITIADKINLAHNVKGSPLSVREIRNILRSSHA